MQLRFFCSLLKKRSLKNTEFLCTYFICDSSINGIFFTNFFIPCLDFADGTMKSSVYYVLILTIFPWKVQRCIAIDLISFIGKFFLKKYFYKLSRFHQRYKCILCASSRHFLLDKSQMYCNWMDKTNAAGSWTEGSAIFWICDQSKMLFKMTF